MLNTPLYFNNRGIAESFTSPFIDLTSASNPALTFDIAHNYLKYGPPNNIEFRDTLDIYISTDGGDSYNRIYHKYGSELATADSPLLNKMTIADCVFYPSASQWRKEVISLSDYKENASVLVKFMLKSGMGGSTAIDNISFKDNKPGFVLDSHIDFSIFPNPASSNVHISSDFYIETITVHDILGKYVYEGAINDYKAEIDVSGLAAGAYYITISSFGKNYNEILTVK
jgi:hypothetical protein